jgi:ABC-type transporter Mla maintaining outer membrane lipid asymmetry ATPase subunit MlaF
VFASLLTKRSKAQDLWVLDTGHVVFASKPDEFLKLVEPFIRDFWGSSKMKD